MKYKPLEIGMIYYPSVRAIAYLNIFKELGRAPNEVILMKGAIPVLNDIRNDDKKYRYSKKFFNLQLDVMDYFNKSKERILKVDSTDINDSKVLYVLQKSVSKYFIFTGGGILGQEFFNIGKKFIHIHPGLLPSFRGSTCFYYSLLENYSLGSTGFIMEKKIDKGKIIDSTSFNINYKIEQSETMFMDYILDPYIRAVTLKKILLKFIKDGKVRSYPQPYTDKSAYYIMHPILRYLTIKKINKNFRSSVPSGIIEN